MSAPNGGRQSPEPEQQHGSQQSDTPAGSGKIEQGKEASAGSDGASKLESNPKHVLEDESKNKSAKS